MEEKISLIVTLYNRLEYARNMILALQQQTKQIDELIFADDGSSEDVYEYIKDLDIKIVTCKNGVGSITTLSLLESLLDI